MSTESRVRMLKCEDTTERVGGVGSTPTQSRKGLVPVNPQFTHTPSVPTTEYQSGGAR